VNGQELGTVGVCMMLIASGICCLALLAIHRARRSLEDRAADAWHRPQGLEALLARLEGLERRAATDIDRRTDEMRRLLDEANDCIAVLRRLVGRAGPDAATGPEQSRRHMDVLRLAEQGLNAVEIARGLRMHVGEVELVLGLHRCANAGPSSAPSSGDH